METSCAPFHCAAGALSAASPAGEELSPALEDAPDEVELAEVLEAVEAFEPVGLVDAPGVLFFMCGSDGDEAEDDVDAGASAEYCAITRPDWLVTVAVLA